MLKTNNCRYISLIISTFCTFVTKFVVVVTGISIAITYINGGRSTNTSSSNSNSISCSVLLLQLLLLLLLFLLLQSFNLSSLLVLKKMDICSYISMAYTMKNKSLLFQSPQNFYRVFSFISLFPKAGFPECQIFLVIALKQIQQ